MTVNNRFWAISFFILGLVILVLMVSGLSGLEFREGTPFFISSEEQAKIANKSNFNLWSQAKLWDYFGQFVFWILLPISMIYFIISKEVRRIAIRRAAILGTIMYAYLILVRQLGLNAEEKLIDIDSAAEVDFTQDNFMEAVFQPEITQWMQWLANFLFVLLVAFLVWRIIRGWKSRKTTLDHLAVEASEAIQDLQSGADLKDTILNCYLEMSNALQSQRGIQRKTAMTPREFEIELERSGLPQEQIRRLTRLFEMVRYGNLSLGQEEQAEAITCLQAIVDASKDLPDRQEDRSLHES